MLLHSKKRAKSIESSAIPVFGFAILMITLLALWPAAPASASTIRAAPCNGDGLRDAPCLALSGDRRAGITAQPPVEVATSASRRRAVPARLVLAPRRLAASPAPGLLGIDFAGVAPQAASLMVQASWVDVAGAETQDNPFSLVGNRAGLVNATQAEVRGGEVWLTLGAGHREAAPSGGLQTAAP